MAELAANRLENLRRRLRKRGRRLEHIDDRQRHQLRKDAKKLRYAVEFLGALFGGTKAGRRRKRFVQVLHRLQGKLGALNDLAVARVRLDQLGLADTDDARALFHHWKRKRLLAQAAEARHDLLALKPFWR